MKFIKMVTPILMSIFVISPLHAAYDDFQGSIVDLSKWEIEADAGTSVSQTGGRLELSILPSANGDIFEAGVESTSAFSGNFDLQVDFSLASWPHANGVRSALGIDSETGSGLIIERSASSPANVFPERYVMNGPTLSNFTPTSDQSGKLRLQRVGNLITGYALDAVVGWQTVASYTNDELGIVNSDPLTFYLSVWSHDNYFPGGQPVFNPGGQPVTVAFDNVMLIADTVVPIPAAAWLFGSGLLGLIGFSKRKKAA